MSETSNQFHTETLSRLAEETGLAIAIINADSHQAATSNNNSICRHLNPSNEFSPACARYCGKALDKALEAGKMIGFECHAGLDCRAVAAGSPEKPFVAIIGRTFLKSENYYNATTRAISGDWSSFSPSAFFENVLLTGSSATLTKTAEKVEQILNEHSGGSSHKKIPVVPVVEATPLLEIPAKRPDPIVIEQDKTVRQEPIAAAPISGKPKKRTAEAQAWRSFFGSILKTDYDKAASSILKFIAHQYGLSALVWLEKTDDRFENRTAFGEMKDRKIRLGISPDDQRLTKHFTMKCR